MTADPSRTHAHPPDEPSRVRAMGMVVFLMLATAFLYQTMDGMQRASEEAERRQRIAQSACHDCYTIDSSDDPADQAAEIAAEAAATALADAAADAAAAAAAEVQHARASAPNPAPVAPATTAPVEVSDPAPAVPVVAPHHAP